MSDTEVLPLIYCEARHCIDHDAARPQPAPDLRADDARFLAEAAYEMRRRFDHGATKFGRYSWREDPYLDEDNLTRLRRAVDHLEAARANSDDPAEWQKRAADVANQAFMFADPERYRPASARSALHPEGPDHE